MREIIGADQNEALKDKYFYHTSIGKAATGSLPELHLPLPLKASLVCQKEWAVTCGSSDVSTLMTEGVGRCIAVLI